MLEQPNTQFAIYRSPTVGDNQAGGISAMQLPGTRIRGVIVDNPSGSWVKLSGTGLGFEPFIPPYTLAWSVSLLPSVLEIAASYVVGPTGQASSTAGAPLVVYLFEAQVPSSGGSAFIDSQAEQSTAWAIFTAGQTVANQVLIPAVADKRIRLTYVAAKHTSDDSVNFVFMNLASTVFAGNIGLTPARRFDDVAFPHGGFDLPVGDGLQVATQTQFMKVQVDIVYGWYMV
jgi:hypothetical protein